VAVVNGEALLLLLHVLGAHLQHADQAGVLLALGLDHHDGPGGDILAAVVGRVVAGGLGVREAAAGRRQAGDHEGRTGQHEADGAAVDAQAAEAVRVLVHEAQVRGQRVVEALEEERLAGEGVEGDALLGAGRVSVFGDGGGAADSLTTSSWAFLGRMSSMWGSRRGYVSTSLARRVRWTEDLTFERPPGIALGQLGWISGVWTARRRTPF
jgi:hypothetical protein